MLLTRLALFMTSLVALMMGAPGAAAQLRPDSAAAADRAQAVYGPDTLFTIHGSIGPFGPEARARGVETRLARWGPGLATGRDTLFVLEVEQGTGIFVNDELFMAVTDADAAPFGQPRAVVAAAWAARIKSVVADVHHQESISALIADGAKASVATLVLVLLLIAVHKIAQRLRALLTGPQMPALRIKQLELLPARKLGEVLLAVARAMRVVITIVLLYVYVPLVLSFFPGTALLSRRIVGYVVRPLLAVGSAIVGYLPNLLYIVVIVFAARYLLRLIQLVFDALGSGAMRLQGFHRSWVTPSYNIVRFLVVAFAAVVMFPYLPGAGSEGFKGVSLFVGVLLSFGSSAAIGNIIAGVVLTYTNAFEVGDVVQIGETYGAVIERTALVTRIRSIKNEDITIPNGTVLTSQVKNFTTESKGRGLILHSTVTIGYNAPWRQIHELLIAAAGATANVLKDPKPFVLQTALDDFYVRYQINAYTDRPEIMSVTYSLLHQNIQDKFFEAGVEIMSPHYLAARDGSMPAIPEEKLPKGHQGPPFRVDVGQRER